MPTYTLSKSQKYEKFQGIDIAKYFLNNFPKYNNNDTIEFFSKNVTTEEKNNNNDNYIPMEFPKDIQSEKDIEIIKEKYNAQLDKEDACIFLEKFFKALEDYKRDLIACQNMKMFICGKTKTDNYTLYCELSLWYLDSFIMEVPYELSFLKFITFDSLFEKILNTPEKYYSLVSEKYDLKKISFDNLISVVHDDEKCCNHNDNSSLDGIIVGSKEEDTESDECESISSSEGEDILDVLNEEAYGDEYSYYVEKQEKMVVVDELPFKRDVYNNKNNKKTVCVQKTVYSFWHFMIITFLNLYLINHDKNGFYLLTKENFIKLQYKIMCLLCRIRLNVFFESPGNIIDEVKYYYTKISEKQTKYEPIINTKSKASIYLDEVSSIYTSEKSKKLRNTYPLGTIGYYFCEQKRIQDIDSNKKSHLTFSYDRTTHNCLWDSHDII